MLDKILDFIASKLALIEHDSGWKNVPAGDASGYTKFTLSTFKYRTKGDLCWLNFYNNAGSMSTGWKNVGRLPAGARPAEQVNASMCNRAGVCCEIQIFTNGNVFLNSSASMNTMSQVMSFPYIGGV